MSEKSITPQEIVLNAYDYFKTETLALESLITIMIAAGCPTSRVAQGILLRMVESKLLTWKKESDKVTFSRVKPSKRGEHTS